jgi:hypothetical protein
LLACCYKLLFANAKSDTNPLRRHRTRVLTGMRRATAQLHFLQQLKWLFD